MARYCVVHQWPEQWRGFRKSVDDWGRFFDKWQYRICLRCGKREEQPKPERKKHASRGTHHD